MREELIAEGVKFRTNGDTEVILEALIRWNIDALIKFNGMFAVGFWDNKLERLIIARDRLGVKPLLYSHKNLKFAFASEYPPLLILDWVNRTTDPVGITAYLSHFQTTFNGKTIYRDVSSLDGGEYAVFDKNGFSKQRYWTLPALSSQRKRDLWPDKHISEAAKEIQRLMGEAVKSHSIADVDVGVFLSGGIDSALITTLMCEQSAEKVKAFSIGFAEEGFNEFEFSGAITENLGLRHKVITFNEADYFPTMREIIRHKRTPLSTPNEVPIFALARETSKDMKVVLTGEGADELFGGYTGIFRSPEHLALSEHLRKHPDQLTSEERNSIRDSLRKFYGKSGFRGELDHWTTAYAWLARGDLPLVLGDAVNVRLALDEIDACWQSKFNALDGLSTFDRYLYLFQTEHLRGLLTRLDACTMAGSLEGRVPFTDNSLVEFVWSLPFEYKLRWKIDPYDPVELTFDRMEEEVVGKFIMKEAFKDRIASSISSRKKRAFPVPLEAWMNGSGREQVMCDLKKGSQFIDQQFNAALTDWVANTLATGAGAMKVWMVWNMVEWIDGN